jgi:lysophospholipase L1-like esterase
MTIKRIFWTSTIVVLSIAAYVAVGVSKGLEKALSEDPLVWASDIEAFVEKGVGEPGSLLFVGSSSIRFWDNLAEDMAPLPVINRGFGGSKIGAVVHYADALFRATNPHAIVIFVGTNDMTPEQTKSVDTMSSRFVAMMSAVRKQHPDAPVYYIAITPSPLRWAIWNEAKAVNEAIQVLISQMPDVHFIDTSEALMSGGEPNPDNYVFDKLHLSAKGYDIWAEIVRSRIFGDLGLL